MLDPGLEVSSAAAWLRATLMIFIEGVFWTLWSAHPWRCP